MINRNVKQASDFLSWLFLSSAIHHLLTANYLFPFSHQPFSFNLSPLSFSLSPALPLSSLLTLLFCQLPTEECQLSFSFIL
jgi:hypothetical protein